MKSVYYYFSVFWLLIGSSNLYTQTSDNASQITDDAHNLCFTYYYPTEQGSKVTKKPFSNYVGILGKTRAKLTNTTSQGEKQQIDTTFHFFGIEGNTALGSNRVVYQAAIKLFERDACNVVYVTYRVNPSANDDLVKIQIKSNTAFSTFQECRNNGYQTIKDEVIESSILSEENLKFGIPVRMKAILDPQNNELCLTVMRKGETVLQRCYDLTVNENNESIAGVNWLSGHLGLRTDNVDVQAELHEPSLIQSHAITKKEQNHSFWNTYCAE